MAGGRVYPSNSSSGGGGGSNNLSVLLQSQRVPSSAEPLDSLFISGSASSSFLVSGTRSMVSFEDVHGTNRANGSFFRTFDQDENEDLDEYFHQPEKKRRLAVDQVQFLEKSFEVDNKLEPERKIQLAKDLGLQPRQVAIWFQNRRARWKTKQMEKDYGALQASYNSLKADYDNLLKEKDKLKEEVLQLTDKLLVKEKEKEKGKSESCDMNTLSQEPPPQKPVVSETASEVEDSKVSVVACKQEDISSARSDTFDSDSPHYTDGVHSSILEAADSSYPFEPDQSDSSQDEEDNLSKGLLHNSESYIFPKLEDEDYSDPPASSCNFGFPVEDHAFWAWEY